MSTGLGPLTSWGSPVTKKKKNAKTQHKKGEPITDKNRLTKDITKALRFYSNDNACIARTTLESFGLIRATINCVDIGDWTYLVADLPGDEPLFIADPTG